MRRLRGSSARLPRRSELFRRILARLRRVLDLAFLSRRQALLEEGHRILYRVDLDSLPGDAGTHILFDLPDRHPDRMIAAQIVLYVGLGTVIAAELWNDWQVLHP